MKLAIFSDVHGNLPALEAVRIALEREAPDRVWFLGDAVGYGAHPNECVAGIRRMAHVFLAGNHDWAASGRCSAETFTRAAREAIHWTSAHLQHEHAAFLAALPRTHREGPLRAVHATPGAPECWNYILTAADAAGCFREFSQQCCFVAHSHVPAVFVRTPDGNTRPAAPEHLVVQTGLRCIINCGSAGQPRDGNPAACLGLFDTRTGHYRLVRIPYDTTAAGRAILDAGLPPVLAARLESGR